MYYNRFRYYNPDTGQYISPDPIGLLGGVNPYGYVHNPSRFIDPFGLAGADCDEILTYRGDTRHPDEIFNDGFKPWGTSKDLYKHTMDAQDPPSYFISTTTSPGVAAEFGSEFYTGKGFVYAIKDKKGAGIDVNATLGRGHDFAKEVEIAYPGGIAPEKILGASPVNERGDFIGYSILNPNRYGKK
ncbi:RHS repeat-associated core domain-containing protein [Xenorhabdus bovienii]|uniref:RHS repeat-associated core domain-containing protein n=1 Tax=Xenorhabdus bovienii TaxID=40576 RepID=UPI00387E9627